MIFHEHFTQGGLWAKYGNRLGGGLKKQLCGVDGIDGLRALAREGTPDTQAPDENGAMRTIKGEQPEFLTDNTRAYLITDEVQPGEVAGVVLHEVGVHHSMGTILGAERFSALQKRMEGLRARGDADVVRAYENVPDDTPKQHVNHEAIAYLAEESPNHTITQRLVDGTKLFDRGRRGDQQTAGAAVAGDGGGAAVTGP